ncbi:POC1 centriolar protein-like A [Papilio machaon]|uniref:POC1 centriolar protein-like A n=1 Tax=Papilio machaon TaxID=76193 RepID=A0A194RDE8_PAPMA|nr:POC1 centriolar protein-like A [Papilio machaon]
MDYSSTLKPTLEKQLKGHHGGITALFYNPNDTQIASSSMDHSVLLWDLSRPMRSYRFQGHEEAVMDVTFSPRGKYMASASRDKTVRLWVPTVTGSTGVFKAHSQTVRSVQFNPDGSRILTASDDKIVKLWSSEKYKFISSFVGHTNWVRCARMSHDGSVIASCSDDKTTRLWSPDTGKCIHEYKDHKVYATHLSWHPSGCYIAIGSSHGNVMVYDIRTHNLVQYYSIHNDAVTQLAFHPSGSYILTSGKDGKIKILDLLEGHPIFTVTGHNGAVNSVNFSTSGSGFASGGEDKMVFIWRTNFTEFADEGKENEEYNQTKSAPQSASQKATSTRRTQGARLWYKCYHSSKYPIVTFVHLDDPSNLEEPVASSTFYEETNENLRNVTDPINITFERNPFRSGTRNDMDSEVGSPTFSVGHNSHIPRTPPNPSTYRVPSVINCSARDNKEEDLFGMIKLKETDICYTSGTIEWVGRKRTFPLNTGFKVISDSHSTKNETFVKRAKKDPLPSKLNTIKECDCADVLPTVNAIVDHLNALHEAVDIVDLRLNTLEEVAIN